MLVLAVHHRGGPFVLVLLALLVVGGVVYVVSHRRPKQTTDVLADPDRPRRGATGVTPAPPDPESGNDVAAENDDNGARSVRSAPPANAAAPERVRTRRPIRTGDWAVETHGLSKRFGDNVAVDNVELLVPRGSAFGYLGPNGAGKTTLMRTLLGLTHADSGTVSLLGIPMPRERTRALARVGAIVDEPRFHGHLTGRQNLEMLAAARGGDASTRIISSVERVGLTGRENHPVGSYSMGMRQRLGVAACLIGDPELLILDEPMNGLDPAGMQEMRNMVHSLVDEGRTVMLSSHLLDEVERTCDAVAIVDHGRVIRQGEIEDLLRTTGGAVIKVRCSDPRRAAALIEVPKLVASVDVGHDALTITLADGATDPAIAEINRRLVEGSVDVFRLEEIQTTLEDWFLSVTSRIGQPA